MFGRDSWTRWVVGASFLGLCLGPAWGADAPRKHAAEKAGARAIESKVTTQITFQNQSSQPLKLYWLTDGGQRQLRVQLRPGVSRTESTFVTHPWLITDASDNALAVFYPDPQPRTVQLTTPQLAEWASEATKEEIVLTGADGARLQSFAVGPDDNLYAVLSASQAYGAARQPEAAPQAGEVRVVAADGREIRRWTVDFAPERIGVAPDGTVYVGGSGMLTKYSADGKQLIKPVESPHLKSLGDPAVLRQRAEETRKSMVDSMNQQIKNFEETLARLDKEEQAAKERQQAAPAEPAKAAEKPAEKPAAEKAAQARTTITVLGRLLGRSTPQSQRTQTEAMLKSYRQMRETYEKRPLEQYVDDITKRVKKVSGITASSDAVYVVTGMSSGYGFAVWRMTTDFAEPKEIITGLSGCCGQMDVQAKGNELFVAENSRKRVLRYDRDGNKVGQFGSAERGGSGEGFGGCCNPMNVCFLADGNVLTAESEGKVKQFTPDGKFVGPLAAVGGVSGCKNVTIGVTKAGDRLFFLDLNQSKVLVVRPQAGDKPAAPGEGASKTAAAIREIFN